MKLNGKQAAVFFKGAKGETGAKLVKMEFQGQDANGGNVYLMTFDDGTTARFVSPKGKDGKDGVNGKDGKDGVGVGEFADTVNELEYSNTRRGAAVEIRETACNNGLNDTAIDLLAQILAACTQNVDIADKIDALKSALKLGDNDISLRLPRNLPIGRYTLKYENEQGATDDCLEICSFEITAQGESLIYDKFINENCAPDNAAIVGVYNSTNERVGDIVLGALSRGLDLGEKLYSFAAFSDIHIGDKAEYVTRFQNIISDLEGNDEISLIAICGDMVDDANKTEQLQAYSNVVKNVQKPVLTAMGNHEMTNILSVKVNPLSYEDIRPYFEQAKDEEWGIDRTLHYCFTPNGSDDVFIMFGISGLYSKYASLSADDIKWLHNVLEANRNKRCFLFHHYFPWEGSGDAVNCYNQNGLQGNGGEAFYSLLKHYKNVIYFHGHTHAKFSVQEFNAMNTIDTIYGRYSVHIPSLTNPSYPDFNAMIYLEDTRAGEGYIVDVYENGVVLKGKDFVNNKYSPIGYYCLDTTVKEIAENSYYDEYGFTAKSLKSGNGWYTGCTIEKSLITKISFVDAYMDAYDEMWKPTVGESNIVAYRNGTEIFIVGNGDIVKANANSKEMFAGFSSLIKIDGLLRLDMSNVTDIEGMFSGCAKLEALNLQGFAVAKPVNMKSVFYGCASLAYINLSNLTVQDCIFFNNMCNGCSSLREIKMPAYYISDRNKYGVFYASNIFENCAALERVDMTRFAGGIYLSTCFKGCSSLKEVKFGNTVLAAFANVFTDCTSIEVIDISSFDISKIDAMVGVFKNCKSLKTVILPSSFDTSKIKNMTQLFYNCPNLHIDCSSWDTTSLTSCLDFKYKSPNVIAPFAD